MCDLRVRSSSNRAGQWFNSGLSVKVNVLEQDNLTRLDTEDAASVLGWLTLLLMDCSIVAAVLVELCICQSVQASRVESS